VTDEAAALVQSFRGATQAERRQLNEALERSDASALLGFAAGCADRVVRERSPAHAENGVAALCLEGGWPDYRDTLIVLTRLHHSLTVLGLDAGAHLLRVADEVDFVPVGDKAYFEAAGPALVRRFVARPPDLKSLEAMGQVLIETPDGPAYRWG
jgi:hypothetical protein